MWKRRGIQNEWGVISVGSAEKCWACKRGLGINAKKYIYWYEGVIVPTALYGLDTWGLRSAETSECSWDEVLEKFGRRRGNNEEVRWRAGIEMYLGVIERIRSVEMVPTCGEYFCIVQYCIFYRNILCVYSLILWVGYKRMDEYHWVQSGYGVDRGLVEWMVWRSLCAAARWRWRLREIGTKNGRSRKSYSAYVDDWVSDRYTKIWGLITWWGGGCRNMMRLE